MNFEYSEEQQQFADSVQKFLAGHYGFEQRKEILNSPAGLSESLWHSLAEMGLTSISVPESEGGFGGGALDLIAPMEACGEALVVEPLIDNIGLAGRLIAKLGSPAQCSALLPGLMDGSHRYAFASFEPGRRYEIAPTLTTASPQGDGWILSGTKCIVMGAPSAHRLVVSAVTDSGPTLFLVDPQAAGVALNSSRTVDGQRSADVVFTDVALAGDALQGKPGEALPWIEEAMDFSTALLCADAVGAMKYANEATLEYLKTRKQFGVPIASFQVLQHRMVEMMIACEQARSMSILAASKVDSGAEPNERKRAISMAFVKVADSARQISQESVQLHGGMGMTEELKISHTFRRLTMISQRLGDADHHLERYASLG